MSDKPITRPQWSKKHRVCMVCGTNRNLQTHEIPRGPAKAAAMKEPAAWLRVCGAFGGDNCHEALGDYGQWPPERQLALKKMRDKEHYDRVKVNLLRFTEPEAITEAEVDQWVQTMEGE